MAGHEYDRTPAAAHTGINHGDMHGARGEIAVGAIDDESALVDLVGGDFVANINHFGVRQERMYDALHGADVAVVLAEVGGHGDDGGPLASGNPIFKMREHPPVVDVHARLLSQISPNSSSCSAQAILRRTSSSTAIKSTTISV